MATVRKRPLPSGTSVWIADYRDGAGKRRFKQFRLKKDADAYLLDVSGGVVRGTHVADAASITVADACDRWLERAESDGLERSTLAAYRQHVRLHIVPLIGATKLSRLNGPAVQAFADQLAKTKSRAMVKRVVGSLGRAISEAQRLGKAGTNPARDVRIRMPKRDGGRLEMPTKAEIRSILKAATGKHRPFIYTATFTGLRSSELRGLQWRDVDLKGGALTVQRRADTYNQIGPPKSAAGYRDIPLTPTVIGLLEGWRDDCPKGELSLVFPNGAGNIESHRNILSRVFWPIQIEAGVRDMVDGTDKEGQPTKVPRARYGLHALRHAAAALFIEQGFPPKRVQALMGHSSIQMTFDTYGYLFPSPDDDRGAMKALEDRLLSD